MNLSSGHTDENISVSVSSRNPKPSVAEALHLPIDDQSHQKPSEGQNTRESIKNAENSQSIALTQCNLVQMQFSLSLNFVILL